MTGVTGFVGSALLTRLIADKAEIKALVRNETVSLPDEVKRVVADLRDIASTSHSDRSEESRKGFKDSSASLGMTENNLRVALSGVDVVVHAAARAHIMRDEEADPLVEYRKVNRDATLTLARLAAEAGVKRFVFVSSIKVNGEMTETGAPFESENKKPPVDPYGLSKYEAELGLLDIAQETGMEAVIIRPPLVYGPGVKGNFSSMVSWVKKGVPLPLGAVHNKRSLVALENLVDFIAFCADRERSQKAANEVFLISDGEDVSTSSLLRKLAKAYGIKSRLLPVPASLMKFTAKLLGKGDAADRLFGSLQVDSSKARDLLGWKPLITMDEQLAKMADAEKLH